MWKERWSERGEREWKNCVREKVVMKREEKEENKAKNAQKRRE